MMRGTPRHFDARGWSVAGLVATFAAVSAGYWMPALGLPRLDFASLNGNLVAPESSGAAFAWSVGLLDTFALGALGALLYGRFLRSRLPGSGPVRASLWALVLCAIVGLTAFPLLFGAGVFGIRWDPATPIALVSWHLVWGVALGIIDDRLLADAG